MGITAKHRMAGNGTHGERIELIERRFETMEAGMARMEKMEQMLEKLLQEKTKLKEAGSLSNELSESDGSSDVMHPARTEEEEVRPRSEE